MLVQNYGPTSVHALLEPNRNPSRLTGTPLNDATFFLFSNDEFLYVPAFPPFWTKWILLYEATWSQKGKKQQTLISYGIIRVRVVE